MNDKEIIIAVIISLIIFVIMLFGPLIVGFIFTIDWEYFLRKKSYWDVDITGIEPAILCMHCKKIASNKTMYCPNCGRAMKNYWDNSEGEDV